MGVKDKLVGKWTLGSWIATILVVLFITPVVSSRFHVNPIVFNFLPLFLQSSVVDILTLLEYLFSLGSSIALPLSAGYAYHKGKRYFRGEKEESAPLSAPQ
jgi:hypothetical protein